MVAGDLRGGLADERIRRLLKRHPAALDLEVVALGGHLQPLLVEAGDRSVVGACPGMGGDRRSERAAGEQGEGEALHGPPLGWMVGRTATSSPAANAPQSVRTPTVSALAMA